MKTIKNNAKFVSELLKVLANEYRLQIVCTVADGPKNVTEIAEQVTGISQSALSQHLALLKAHKILSSNKCGQHISYSVEDNKVLALLTAIKTTYYA